MTKILIVTALTSLAAAVSVIAQGVPGDPVPPPAQVQESTQPMSQY
ncbi:MAG: hypothetical protein ACK5LJ_14325 [Paracoccus sp. (in: a-proteobacteria)]